ncbi:MAG: YggS family pyridoxal phosphate-dependent enzyme [Cyclobacteriaceae bacterium]
MSIKSNIVSLWAELAPRQCKLVAVSKTHPQDLIMEAYEVGQRIFGENKAQELVSKWEVLPKDIEWHMIGHLQSNKVKYIVPFVKLIHSVDSQKLLIEINKQAAKVNRVIHCLLQVHIASEETKFGMNHAELRRIIGSLPEYPFVRVKGLMGMATLTDDTNQIRKEFAALRVLKDELKKNKANTSYDMDELSIGMSSDYQIALEEGSTMVRIGSSVFGERKYS